MSQRVLLRASATQATADSVGAAVARLSGLPVVGVHRGAAALQAALGVDVTGWYVCRRGVVATTALQDGTARILACWVGVAQTQRKAKDGVSAWTSAPWCPRCGAGGEPGMPAPALLAEPAAGSVLVVRMGPDVPEGVQPDEQLPGEGVDDLPPALLRVLRQMRDRIVALEARLAAAGIP